VASGLGRERGGKRGRASETKQLILEGQAEDFPKRRKETNAIARGNSLTAKGRKENGRAPEGKKEKRRRNYFLFISKQRGKGVLV